MAAPRKPDPNASSPSSPPAEPPARPRRKRSAPEPSSRGLDAREIGAAPLPDEISELGAAVERDGGQVLAAYRDPLGGTWILLTALPIDRVEPTPFQRDLSRPHAERLRSVLERIGRFLDPVIAVREADRYWTPNGRHRLEAMRQLGARAITALLVTDPAIAYRILALNTEKAHNLRERALEVARMYHDLVVRQPERKETEFALEFEEAALITLGLCYEERPRFAAGAYHSLVRRIDPFLAEPLATAQAVRARRAQALLTLDELVESHVAALRAQGLDSPYLRNLVVARLQPPWARGETGDFDETLAHVMKRARAFDPRRIRREDIAAASGTPPEEA